MTIRKGLTQEIAYKALQGFFQEKPFVLFGTGTSCAVHPDYGMPALSHYLEGQIKPCNLSTEQQSQWDFVTSSLRQGKDLESAMNDVTDNDLITMIVNHTADLIISLDKVHGRKILLSTSSWPALTLFRCIVNGLRHEETLHVATPNYDLLAEYAFEQADIPYSTGFVGGVCRRLNWPTARLSMSCRERIQRRGKIVGVTKCKRHIQLYKVHGSLNTFQFENEIIENNAWMFDVPDGIKRQMITPGTIKYEKLLENRSELLSAYDGELVKHNAFLFIGFGFNDKQLIEGSLMRKLIEQKCPALIITHSSNDRIEALSGKCENLWLVCSKNHDGKTGTRIFNLRKGELFLDDVHLWDSKQFAELILGG